MATKTNSGFTIIETVLYLAVSSALVAAILMGVGRSVTQQRYTDSVNSLKSYLQEQYGVVASTTNGRLGNEACSKSGSAPSEAISFNNGLPAGTGQRPGTSECLIIGRYVESVASSNGNQLQISNVIAHPKASVSAAADDVADLKDNYVVVRGTVERERYELPWGARIVNDAPPAGAKVFSMMIVRSPRSGGIMTFTAPATSTGAPLSASGLVSTVANKHTLNLCVDGDRGLGTTAKLRQVRVTPYATAPSGIQVPIESDSVCG